MDQKQLNRVFAALSFLVALIVYILTVQPVVPFWDCGEFSAGAIWQQVPHPPGAPLFLMIGKLFHTFIPFGDPGWRVNLVAVFSSAFTILFTYHVAVKIIQNLRGKSLDNMGDALAVYGSGFIAALALTFSDTFWFNAVESEVYATSSLFVAVIVYVMMKWNEEADKPGSERYILLMAYLIGLSTGVHLLAILAVFPIGMLIYFRKYEFKISTFIGMGIITVLTFFFVYQGVVQYIPKIFAAGAGGILFFIIVLAAGGIAVYMGRKNKTPVTAISGAVIVLMIFGYTTYTQIVLRSNANPPMNENEPDTFERLVSYLSREQYGKQVLWPRRTAREGEDDKIANYIKKDAQGEYVYGPWNPPETKKVEVDEYSYDIVVNYPETETWAELKYMWDYQIKDMYIRYFLWNYAGRASDEQDAPAVVLAASDAAKSMNYKSGYAEEFPINFFALPLLFGLLGLFFHFWKDPRMAAIYLIMFLLMGVLTALAQNQQNPQPRERDYFYAGSFFVWCLWVGMGAYMLIDLARDLMKKKQVSPGIAAAVLILSLVLVPINMAAQGWKIHSRAGNYLAFDYSYNILQSVEKDAVLFTAGDNDTFPVWFLQDVMGVRRDVRIVNQSLAGTSWYVHQLKHREPWGAEKLPILIDDSQLIHGDKDKRTFQGEFGPAKTVKIPVKKDILKQYTDDPNIINEGAVTLTFSGHPVGGGSGNQAYGYYLPNVVTQHIIINTRFERPVYFSRTVPARDNGYSGMDDYLRMEGMAYRVCPVKQNKIPGASTYNYRSVAADPEINDKIFFNIDNSDNYSTGPQYGFKFRNLANPDVYYDKVQTHYMTTYRHMFMNYAYDCLINQKDKEKAGKVADLMNENISPEQFPLKFYEELELAMLYDQAGRAKSAEKYENMCIESCEYIVDNPNLISGPTTNFLGMDYTMFNAQAINSNDILYIGPHAALSRLYSDKGEWEKAHAVLEKLFKIWNEKYLNSPTLLDRLNEYVSYQQQGQSPPENIRNAAYVLQNFDNITLGFAYLAEKEYKEKGMEDKLVDKLKELNQRFEEFKRNSQILNQFPSRYSQQYQMLIKQYSPVEDTTGLQIETEGE